MDNTEFMDKLKSKNMELSKLLDSKEDFSAIVQAIACIIDDMSMQLGKYEVEVE
ncbi:MAG: hypothetical protein RE471_09840 [Ferroplasma sp.]|uniref:hypothetical protein n=1 Tax=Ferroplasma sp. TaxID=2591003 RepID=UPI00281534B0|nr:hypothetical protein [Ferroplasma sp.]WMT51222.1 MAG: hypothetical protein RE471_09620 [Ferroplasma sp.]WMT51265.1 MAG: hypothetical protein RE471_09840 [Ferroplasma sp.]